MHLKDVLNKCAEENYPITASGLYYAGIKYGFLKKHEGERNLDFDKDKFFEYLKKAKEEVPEGWLPLSAIPEKLGISLSQVYILIRNENTGAKSFGSGKGVLYVNPKRIENVIREREEKHKEKWD